jgi:vesicle-fusing ATPase
MSSHDNTGNLQPGYVGASSVQRQWIGLSVSGDEVNVEPLPSPPHPSAPSFLQSIDIECGFLKRGHQIAEVFSADEMGRTFLKAFSGLIFATGQYLVFEYHGQNLKATIKALSVAELADEQRRGGQRGQPSATPQNMGIMMDRTDVTIMKAGDSAIKIKSSAKK